MRSTEKDEAIACEQVVAALDHLAEWMPLRESLAGGQGYVPWIKMDQAADVSSIVCEEGDGQHEANEREVSRGFHAYLASKINPMIDRGEIKAGTSPGSFDDRKLRWADQSVVNMLSHDRATLTLKVGPTCFPHCQRDIHRQRVESLQSMLAGIQAYNDPYAYFARGLGVVVIPLTRDGHVCIGKRLHTSEYKNWLCFVSGWASFSTDIKDIDFYRDGVRELEEELLLPEPQRSNQIQFAGLSGEPTTGEADLIFITQTGLHEEHFEAGTFPEHSRWFVLRSRSEAQQLLEEGRIEGMEETFSLMFSSQAGLEFLINNHWNR